MTLIKGASLRGEKLSYKNTLSSIFRAKVDRSDTRRETAEYQSFSFYEVAVGMEQRRLRSLFLSSISRNVR